MTSDKTHPVPTKEQWQEADESVGIVHLISGTTAAGEDFYAYVSVKPSRYEEFVLIATALEQMNLEEFGQVLKKGFGKKPPPNVRKFMEETYNVDHDFMSKLLSDIRSF